jgi:hypothetical protein
MQQAHRFWNVQNQIQSKGMNVIISLWNIIEQFSKAYALALVIHCLEVFGLFGA